MAKRISKKKGPTPEEDAQEFFLALDMLEKERGIKKEYMLEKITQALVSAYKRDHEGAEENIVIQADPEKNILRMIIRRDVVETVDTWATWSPARSRPRTLAVSPPRPPVRSSFRAFVRQSGAWSTMRSAARRRS